MRTVEDRLLERQPFPPYRLLWRESKKSNVAVRYKRLDRTSAADSGVAAWLQADSGNVVAGGRAARASFDERPEGRTGNRCRMAVTSAQSSFVPSVGTETQATLGTSATAGTSGRPDCLVVGLDGYDAKSARESLSHPGACLDLPLSPAWLN